MSTSLCFPTSEYRVLPFPNAGGRRMKVATRFVRVEDVPAELENWMDVNPRVPRLDKKQHLQGPVAKAMIETLLEDPELFELKNNGMYILAEEVTHEKGEGGAGVATVKLSDTELHGLVNGGHTFLAIREAAETRATAAEGEYPATWNAYVRLHIMVGIEPGRITDIAEGLNRSMQVDNPSLENLRGTFDDIKEYMKGKKGEEQPAYRQGDNGEVEILHVLTCLAMLNLNEYPDRKTHPYGLFGQPKEVLRRFTEDLDKDEKKEDKQEEKKDEKSVFNKMIPHIHEILVLTDWIQQQAMKSQVGLGRLKVSDAKKQNKAGSPKHKGRPAYFAGGTIEGKCHRGWLYPMLAAFRANISRDAWKKGKFEWMVEPSELLNATIDEMAAVVKTEHTDNNRKPAEVGRKEAAYRGCYGVMTMELAKLGFPVE